MRLMNCIRGENTMSKKNKPRWKELSYWEMFARRMKRDGASEEMCEHIRKRGREKEDKVINERMVLHE